MQLDCKYNLAFKTFLEEEIKKGNKQAELTKILFDAQKGINAIDSMSNIINLAKGIKLSVKEHIRKIYLKKSFIIFL